MLTPILFFQRDIEDLTEDAEKTYRFPSNDEQFGMVYMGWRVPGNLVKSMQRRWVVHFSKDLFPKYYLSPNNYVL